jgi:hypothetical protein
LTGEQGHHGGAWAAANGGMHAAEQGVQARGRRHMAAWPAGRGSPASHEFLTHRTICTNVMLKWISSENICQKRPPKDGGTSGQAIRGMCRLGQQRQEGATNPKTSMLPGRSRRRRPLVEVGPAAWAGAGRVTWHMPPTPKPAPCHTKSPP